MSVETTTQVHTQSSARCLRVRSFFIAISLIAITLGGVYWWQLAHRSLVWQRFSQSALDAHLAEDRTVLVVYYSHWKPRPLWRIETPDARFTIRRKHIVPMVANRWAIVAQPDEIDTCLQALGCTHNDMPLAVIYRPNADPKIIRWSPDDSFAANTLGELKNPLH